MPDARDRGDRDVGKRANRSTSQGMLRPNPLVMPTPCVGPVRLIIVSGVDRGRRFLVTADATVGRAPECTIRIRDEQVSRIHARLLRNSSDQLVLEDCSRNQTIVNAEIVERQELSFGDKIQVGNETVLLLAPPDPMEAQALEQGRMLAIGYLSAGIAHDLNNLLGTTISCLDYLDALDETTELSLLGECLDDIRAAANRSADLVARVLLFSQQSRDSHELCDVTSLCDDVLRLIRRSFDRKIEVESELGNALFVNGDRSQLMQLLLNLCINARDAMPKGGTLAVRTSTTQRDGKDYVLFSVEDTGMGMDSETRGRIFERFFTTKPAGDGTGLGLATVLDVTKWHGGIIEVESEPGRGSTFHVWLPRRGPGEREKRVSTTEAPPSPSGSTRRDEGGLILLVDDNQMLRRSTSRLLRQAGHKVLTASDGSEAVAMYSASRPRPELVLLDMDMPGMDGLETFQELRGVNANVKVIFVSGYSSENWAEPLMAEGARGFLQKPVPGKELCALVADVLAT